MRSHTYVNNIHCEGCASTITEQLQESKGIKNVEVNVEEGKVSFDCDDDQCRMEAISVLKKIGYPEKGVA